MRVINTPLEFSQCRDRDLWSICSPNQGGFALARRAGSLCRISRACRRHLSSSRNGGVGEEIVGHPVVIGRQVFEVSDDDEVHLAGDRLALSKLRRGLHRCLEGPNRRRGFACDNAGLSDRRSPQKKQAVAPSHCLSSIFWTSDPKIRSTWSSSPRPYLSQHHSTLRKRSCRHYQGHGRQSGLRCHCRGSAIQTTPRGRSCHRRPDR